MSSTRDALMLVAGVAIGAVGVTAISNVASAPERAPAAVAAVPSGPGAAASPSDSTPEQTLDAARRSLAEERSTRVHAEARIASLEDELSKARSAPTTVASGSTTPAAPGAAAPTASASASEKKALDPAQVAARLKEIEGLIDAALAAKDGKKLLGLYGELARYGKAAWPLATKIGKVFGNFEQGESEELGLNGMEFFKAFVAAEYTELYTDALKNPESYDKEFRKMSIWGIAMTDPAGSALTLVAALKTEKDPQTIQMIAGCLVQSASSSNPPAGLADSLLEALNATKNKQTRQTLIWSLSQMQGQEATRAIASLAAAETDPQAKQQLETSLKVRAIPVAGYYISYVTPKSEAETAGLQVGDVLTAYRGKPIKSWQSLQGTGEENEEVQLVPLVVYRDGQTFTINVKGGKSIWELGLGGDFAKGTAR